MNEIRELDAPAAEAALPDLIALLRDSVDSGASLGFWPPLGEAEAAAYWAARLHELAAGTRRLLVARAPHGRLVGSVQLGLALWPNAHHRAEVQKLMVHSTARRQGLGRALMAAVETSARAAGRSLLVLDTREGDPAETLYTAIGYTILGPIPGYVREADGTSSATVVFYRHLE
jgi:ribosomal protein S18 acetylase RimI-like enzyme